VTCSDISKRTAASFVREGKEHTLYINRQTKKAVAVPRHREVPPGTARAICRALGVPDPFLK
jgi:hypothetical protein